MKIIADLHIHSKYSRATSKDGVPEFLDLWARKKGIGLLGTGDFTHPAWRQELKDKLIPAEDGLYRLKDEFLAEGARNFDGDAPRFVLSGEISSIYKKNGKVRKVHNVILCPVWKRRNCFPTNWRLSATSTPTVVRFWDWTAAIFWRSHWKLVPMRYLSPPISGRLIFRSLALFPVLILSRSVLKI